MCIKLTQKESHVELALIIVMLDSAVSTINTTQCTFEVICNVQSINYSHRLWVSDLQPLVISCWPKWHSVADTALAASSWPAGDQVGWER